jgi:hypothetical protein
MATATLTVQNILDLVQIDQDDLLISGGAASVTTPDLLINYVDRVQQMILGHRPEAWDWMLSTPKKFLTERGQTDYWIGTTAGNAAGEVDTALNLTDLRRVKAGSVIGRSNFSRPFNVTEAPLGLSWQNEDGSYNEGPPQWYRNDEQSPNVLSIYPAPDQGSTYEIVPPAPNLISSTSGALSARVYYVRTTFLDVQGNEGLPSTTAKTYVVANKVLVVDAPQPKISGAASGITYTHFNVYASETEGSETLQSVSPQAIATDWTEPDTGLTTSGASVPTSSDIEPLNGYLMEFRYFKQHTTLTGVSSTLLIPNDFKDVVVAGVNWLAARYLKKGDMTVWEQDFRAGVIRMQQAQNRWGGAKYLRPDRAAQFNRYPGDSYGNFWSGGWNPDPS